MVTPASMRPRVFPAEDKVAEGVERTTGEASMRPRVFPAEDSSGRSVAVMSGWHVSFNEAAGIPRGRHLG